MPVNGLEVLISEDVRGYAAGSLVDYVSTPYGEGFTVELAGYGGYGSCG